jgi:hypothetical protein
MTWDNTFSWFAEKNVRYTVVVADLRAIADAPTAAADGAAPAAAAAAAAVAAP